MMIVILNNLAKNHQKENHLIKDQNQLKIEVNKVFKLKKLPIIVNIKSIIIQDLQKVINSMKVKNLKFPPILNLKINKIIKLLFNNNKIMCLKFKIK